MLKPIWTLLPSGLKTWLSGLWHSLRDSLFGKADSVKDDFKPSEDVKHISSWSDVSGSKIAIVDFSAEWCGPCRRITPLFHELATQYKGQAAFFSVDIDSQQELATDQGVGSIPAFHFYKNGKLVDKLIGADSSKLKSLAEAICQ
jgi:thioredoxin